MIGHVKADHIANEVRMKRSSHHGSFLLVEGPTDKRLFRRFTDPTDCQIVVGYDKSLVFGAVSILDADRFPGALGVVDCDFDMLTGTALRSANLRRGDTHDIETLLLRSSALDSVLCEFGSPDKLVKFIEAKGMTLREWLVRTALPLGYIRFFSIREGLNLKFEGMTFSHFLDPVTLEINAEALRTEICNRSHRPDLQLDTITSVGWPRDVRHDPWQVCCGDDMMEILRFGLRSVLGTNSLTSLQSLDGALRVAYPEEEFRQSELYRATRDWERRNPEFRVFRG